MYWLNNVVKLTIALIVLECLILHNQKPIDVFDSLTSKVKLMHITFEELADKARVWIYQSDRKLSNEETEQLQASAETFTAQWAAHGQALASSAKVFHHQFLVLAVDESQHGASGCSIDSSVAFVKQAEKHFGVNFFDRTKVAYLLNDEIYIESIQNFKNKIAEGAITQDTLIFNNLVATKGEMKENWKAKASETWLSKFFTADSLS